MTDEEKQAEEVVETDAAEAALGQTDVPEAASDAEQASAPGPGAEEAAEVEAIDEIESIEPEAENGGEAAASDAESMAEMEAEAVDEGEAEVADGPADEAVDEPEAETVDEPEAETGDEEAAEVEAIDEIESIEPEAENGGEAAASDAESMAEMEAEAVDEGEAEIADGPADEAVDEPEAETVDEPEAETGDEPEAEAVDEVEGVEAETADEPVAEIDDEPQAEAVGEVEPEAELVDEPEAVVDDEPEADAVAEPEVETDVVAEADAVDEAGAEDVDEPEDDGRHWYVIHCYSGQENKVRHNLEQRIDTMGMKDRIFDVVVPTEEEIEVKDGKRRTVERRVFPGYILVQMILSEESWYVVRNTPGVTGFVGMGNEPTALRPEEVSQIIKRMEAEAPRIKVTYKLGQKVRIIDGPFNDFIGTVDDIDMERAKVRVMVSFFGRETPVELDFLQVEKA